MPDLDIGAITPGTEGLVTDQFSVFGFIRPGGYPATPATPYHLPIGELTKEIAGRLVDLSASTLEGSAIASTNLSALRVVTFNSSGQLIYADKDTPAHAHRAIAYLSNAINASNQTKIYWRGKFQDSNWAWDTSIPIFLGSNGGFTQSAPTTGFVRAIAQPLTATSIFFEPEEAVNL